jgi:integrase
MTMLESSSSTLQNPEDRLGFDEAQLAAASFLARYSGRTLEAYREHLRGFFQWATDHDIDVLATARPHIELFRAWMEERGLAVSTIGRGLSTVCGFYRFARIDGRISANPARTSDDRRSTRVTLEGSTVPSSACSCSPRSSTTAITRHSPCCSASMAFV